MAVARPAELVSITRQRPHDDIDNGYSASYYDDLRMPADEFSPLPILAAVDGACEEQWPTTNNPFNKSDWIDEHNAYRCVLPYRTCGALDSRETLSGALGIELKSAQHVVVSLVLMPTTFLVRIRRAEVGAQPLKWRDELAAIAQKWGDKMKNEVLRVGVYMCMLARARISEDVWLGVNTLQLTPKPAKSMLTLPVEVSEIQSLPGENFYLASPVGAATDRRFGRHAK